MNSRRLFLSGLLSFALSILTQFAPGALAQSNVQGQWQTLSYTMPINPVHAVLLNNGKVLIVSGSGNFPSNKNFQAAIWDGTAGTVTTQPVTWDMFCNSMVVLPDGRPFVLGGTLQYDPFYGQARTSVFDPTTSQFTDQQSMAHGRWYPTGTVLGDGRIMVFSGTNETGGTNSAVEIYTVGSGWSAQFTASWIPPLYPRLHLLPNGNVFYSGPSTSSAIFNTTNNTWATGTAVTNYSGWRTYGSSVLFPLTPANGYKPKVIIMGGGNPSTATTEIIDLSAATPKWTTGPNMSAPRIEMNATILPSGKILAVGGSLNDEDATTAALTADLYDPNADTFTSAGTEPFPRLYHSVSLLLPNGTVWVAGGNPERGTYEPHMEIYSPAYLFNSDGSLATRPTISSLSTTTIGYGSAFTVQTPNAANISNAVLIRNGAVTHAFNADQRYVGLAFTSGSGVLNVTGPPNGNIAPPGYYMLFILNNAGVPSIAKMVQIAAASGTPPTGTITSPAGNVTIAAGQSVTYAGSGVAHGGTITGYSWSFPGGNPSTSKVANPGSVVYSTAGTYQATLTVTDSLGRTDPNPPTRTITVTGSPDFSLTATPPSQPVNQGGSATYSVVSSANNGFAGVVTFSVTGLPTGASASFSPATVTGSGTSVMKLTAGATTPTGSFPITVKATSGALSHTSGVSMVVIPSGSSTPINFNSSFSGAGLQMNGHATLNEARLQLSDNSVPNEAGSAFWTTPVNIQSFTNDFTFQLTNAVADGFTFTVQGVGPTAMGGLGLNLGYGGTTKIVKSAAVKFDLFNNSGEGTNSTGLYVNGATPTTPATALGGGVNLHSGDTFQVHMTYDGTTLTMTITDTLVPADTFTIAFPVNIPATVGGNTAYVGFTAGTGSSTATQQILTWILSNGSTQSAAATPTFSPVAGPYTSTQTVSILDSTPSASIFYTLDGTQPGTAVGGSTLQYSSSSPITVASTKTIKALATASGFTPSATAAATYTITTGPADFALTATPGTQSVTQGSNTAYTATVTPSNGFTGAVGLSASGLPTGASATFNPTSITTTGSSTMTVATSASTPVGTYTVTITGTGTSLTHTTPVTLVVAQSGGGTAAVNFGTGFTATGMQMNGHAMLSGTSLQLSDNSVPNEAGSAFWTTPVNIQSFTNDFTFQLTNAVADGFTFTVQGVGPTAMGGLGLNLGYGGTTKIVKSAAVKFDLFNNSGEGTNSTGLYVNGATPTTPATALGGGVNLHSGDTFQVHMTYDGTTLTMTITDTLVPADTFTIAFPVNIPATVGGNTAYVGFTAGTGSSTATQQILTWILSNGSTQSAAATPTFSPVAGPYTSTQTVSILDSTPSASIFYTLDGTQPGTAVGGSTLQYSSSSPITVASTKTIKALATASGFTPSATAAATYTITTGPADFALTATPGTQSVTQGSNTAYTATVTPSNGFTGAVGLSASGLPTGASATFNPTSITTTGSSTMTVATSASTPVGTYTVTITGTGTSLTHTTPVTLVVAQSGGGTAAVNFGTGFTATGMQMNGHAMLSGTSLQLSDNSVPNEAGSAFWTTPVNIQSFTNDFTFQLTNAVADGFTFTVQGVGPTAMGGLGLNLGYGGTTKIVKSAAVKFDLFNNSGEGTNSTGLYVNGATPTTPATALGGGVNLHSGDTFQVHMTYDGTTLTMTITDTLVPADTFTIAFPVNIPATVGGNTAYVGFTAGTGSSTATQQILTWILSNGSTQSAAATPTFSPVAGPYTSTQTVSILDSTPSASIFYTLDGTQPGTAVGGSTLQYSSSSPITVASTKTIKALATASGFTPSATAAATYTITTGPADFALTATPGTQSVTQGSNTAYTATVTPSNGFTGAVGLSASGLPTGASATFNPTSITTTGSSTMTVATSASTPVGTYTVTITGTGTSLTHTTPVTLVVAQSGGGTAAVNFGTGFTATGMQMNGHAMLSGTRLQLTDATTTQQAASAYWSTPVNVQSFTTNFSFQLINPSADGFTFVIQNAGLTALGSPGGGLGFGVYAPNTASIPTSVAVKFDLFDNDGEGANSTGLYTNGAEPTLPSTALGGGVNLLSGDTFNVQMRYDGTTLTMTITDASVPADTFTASFPINIPATVGGNTALVGFTAGTGGLTATQQIINWTYSTP